MGNKKHKRKFDRNWKNENNSKEHRKDYDLISFKKSLPIYSGKKTLISSILSNDVVLVVGETGCGKTTQLPQYLYEEGFCKIKRIGITQPRRVAAESVARRVAKEMNSNIGQIVGFRVRFENKSDRSTKLLYQTEGMLLRECLIDPELKKYSVIVLDEVHERSINADILSGLLVGVLKRRKQMEIDGFPPLKLVIMSATMDVNSLTNYWKNSPLLYVEGRQHKVSCFYTKTPEKSYVDACVISILQLHSSNKIGDILVFLPGQEDIENVSTILENRMNNIKKKLIIRQLFAALPLETQQLALEPASDGRKVILATTLAETSVTIPGVTMVIDTGLHKVRRLDSNSGVECLMVTPVSRAQAIQRAGRAGREGPGECFRLYTEKEFLKLQDQPEPEILRYSLDSSMLVLACLGLNVGNFPFIDEPPRSARIRALKHLYIIGALNSEAKVSNLGRKLAALPILPSFGKMLLSSIEMNCINEMLTLVSMISVDNPYYTPLHKREEADASRKVFQSSFGDLHSLVIVFAAWFDNDSNKSRLEFCKKHYLNARVMRKADQVRKQLVEYLSKAVKLHNVEHSVEFPGRMDSIKSESISKALCTGLFMNVAELQPDGKSYVAIQQGHQPCMIHPSSVYGSIFGKRGSLPQCVLFLELIATTKHFIRGVVKIDPSWLPELVPRAFDSI